MSPGPTFAIPFIPRGSTRIYAFGTQPVPGSAYSCRGEEENAPIGYRYSDDDGHHWSEVRLIRPRNDPGFRAMSAMRMCETDVGTWLLGSHEADWSYTPMITRQYLLRSTDRGVTWTVLPGARHGGWHCPGFSSEIWVAISTDGAETWSAPRFVCANALAPVFDSVVRDTTCSYCDMICLDGWLHLFMPHRWERVLHLKLRETDLNRLPQPES